jgi:hypothetical protein
MHAFQQWEPALENRSCPSCGVGQLLGPWPVAPRFDQTPGLGPVQFRLMAEETSERS